MQQPGGRWCMTRAEEYRIEFGSHIDENLVNLVDDRVVEEIVSKLKS